MTSYVLVLNAGSSSLKYSLVDGETGEAPAAGSVERIGEASGRLTHEVGGEKHTSERAFPTFEDALGAAVDAFEDYGPSQSDIEVVAVGHRVVHGGERFSAPTLVDDDVVAAVEELVPLAPLHNPANLEGIAVARKLFPDLPQVMVFDTAFHHTIPAVAYTYAVPRGLARRAPHPPLRVPRHLARVRLPRGSRVRSAGRVRGHQRDRAAPRQRRVRDRRTRWGVGRHLDGADAARGAGDGHPLG